MCVRCGVCAYCLNQLPSAARRFVVNTIVCSIAGLLPANRDFIISGRRNLRQCRLAWCLSGSGSADIYGYAACIVSSGCPGGTVVHPYSVNVRLSLYRIPVGVG